MPSLSGRIVASDVTFFYGTKRALDGVTFTIEDGEFVSIAGLPAVENPRCLP